MSNLTPAMKAVLQTPVQGTSAYQCVNFTYQGNKGKVPLNIFVVRTIRLPENGATYDLPPNLGNFPLYNTSDYQDTLPGEISAKGGCFMPIGDDEALWINFESKGIFAVKILVGGVNAISGEPVVENLATQLRRARLLNEKKTIQDYVVVDPIKGGQQWLDGIARSDGKVMQFVAVNTKSKSEYSIESQITGQNATGGIQIQVTPAKIDDDVVTVIVRYYKPVTPLDLYIRVRPSATVRFLRSYLSKKLNIPLSAVRLYYGSETLGRVSELQTLGSYGIENGDIIDVLKGQVGGGPGKGPEPEASNVSVESDGAEMGIGAGALIKQVILADPHPSHIWDRDNTKMFNIRLLNAKLVQQVTGGKNQVPDIPTASAYAKAGLPFYSLPKEKKSGIHGQFEDVLSVGQIDYRKGKLVDSSIKKLQFPVVKLGEDGGALEFKPLGEMVKNIGDLGLLN